LSFFKELNRRNVTRVAIAYGVAGWVLTEVASVVLPTFQAPGWVLEDGVRVKCHSKYSGTLL